MRPKFISTIALVCLMHFTQAGTNEISTKKKVSSHLQFLWGNYASITRNIWQSNMEAPMYSYSIGFEYKAEFSPLFGLRTGVNYFTYGSNEFFLAGETANAFQFTSYIHIPVDILVHQNLRRGRLVYSLGPDIYLPTNVFEKNYIPDHSPIHYHESPSGFIKNGYLGVTAGIGYEKKISDKLSIEFMPDFRVLNVVPFQPNSDDNTGSGKIIMILGLSTYFTFF